ncbi:agrin-like isoform X2 [Brevipalpus obovatus]|uniref:agrin-like isoform X2 n=1 Tax=Brevipalpus obovatus TaxID=246614 RepID=UPI003D9E153F
MSISMLRAVQSTPVDLDNQQHLLKSPKYPGQSNQIINGTHTISSHHYHDPNNPYTMESTLIYRRKKSFYILLSLLILGIVLLIFIAVGSVIIFISYHCQPIGCSFGADCVFDEDGRQPYCRCTHQCAEEKGIVCGTDNITYTSLCQLSLASCERQTAIYFKHEGPCITNQPKCSPEECKFGATCRPIDGGGSECRCSDKCLDYGEVVRYLKSTHSMPISESMAAQNETLCGIDGKVYENYCQLVRASCEAKKRITIKYNGLCDPCKDIICPADQICQLDDDRRPSCSCNKSCSLKRDTNITTICASDGQIYSNECSMQWQSCQSKFKLRAMERSYCTKGNHPCNKMSCHHGSKCRVDEIGVARCECPICPAIYRPVCGSNRVTYDSVCHIIRESCQKQINLTISYHNQCDHDRDTVPVSRSDGVELAAGHCTLDNCLYGGVCVTENPANEAPRDVCHCIKCPEDDDETSDPICGSNGITYANECKLREDSCKTQKVIHTSHKGPCRSCDQLKCKYYATCEANSYNIHECVCPQVCLQMDAKVCGSDGKTYDNECELRVRACRAQKEVTVAQLGPCDDCQKMTCRNGAHCEGGRCVCLSSCPQREYEPICANDGNTYPNECEMRKNACLSDMDLRVFFYGTCEESDQETGSMNYVDTDNYESDETAQMDSPLNLAVNDYQQSPRTKYLVDRENKLVCKNFDCLFGGICRNNEYGLPYCDCNFKCDEIGIQLDVQVCASDGRLYDNVCVMKQESCRRQESLRPMAMEHCKVVIKRYDPGNMQCRCNKLGSLDSQCSPSKPCKCKPNLTGLRCDRCEHGFWGLHKLEEEVDENFGCIDCSCNQYGSRRKDCDQMDGKCDCKPLVDGLKCDRCPKNLILTELGCVNERTIQPFFGYCEDKPCKHNASCQHLSNNEIKCFCDFECPSSFMEDNLEPICGSNGVIYNSLCELKLHSCRTQSNIRIVSLQYCEQFQSIRYL